MGTWARSGVKGTMSLVRSTTRSPRRPHVSGGALSLFLFRHPWANERVLRFVFGDVIAEALFSSPGGNIQVLEHAQQILYARVGETPANIPLSTRLNTARECAGILWGKEPLLEGGTSPGYSGADLDLQTKGLYWRIWVDLGECAIEASKIVQKAPVSFHKNVRDLIVTVDETRLGGLVSHVKNRWGGYNDILVAAFGTDKFRTISPRQRYKYWFYPPGKEKRNNFINERMSGDNLPVKRYFEWSGDVSSRLSPLDWQTLLYLGYNPMFTRQEIAYVLGGSARDQRVLEGCDRMLKLGLLQDGVVKEEPDRLALSSRSLTLFAMRWDVSRNSMRRFQPWPQKYTDDGWIEYSVKSLTRIDEHTRLVRQFCLSLKSSSARINMGYQGVDFEIQTTVGHRLLYRATVKGLTSDFQWVIPDAKVVATKWKAPLFESRPSVKRSLSRHSIFFEMDRATNSVGRLDERLDKYAAIWPALMGSGSELVWVIGGNPPSPGREVSILKKMEERKISGYSVLLDRLCLPPADPWWGITTPGLGEALPHSLIGGMAPLRKIWRRTSMEGLVNFLD